MKKNCSLIFMLINLRATKSVLFRQTAERAETPPTEQKKNSSQNT